MQITENILLRLRLAQTGGVGGIRRPEIASSRGYPRSTCRLFHRCLWLMATMTHIFISLPTERHISSYDTRPAEVGCPPSNLTVLCRQARPLLRQDGVINQTTWRTG